MCSIAYSLFVSVISCVRIMILSQWGFPLQHRTWHRTWHCVLVVMLAISVLVVSGVDTRSKRNEYKPSGLTLSKISTAVLAFLNPCANGMLPHRMKVFKPSCGLLRDKWTTGNDRFMQLRSIHTAVHQHNTIEGEIDMSKFFHGVNGFWKLKMDAKQGRVAMSATPGTTAGSALVSVSDLIQMSKNLFHSPSTRDAINNLDLGQYLIVNCVEFDSDLTRLLIRGDFTQNGNNIKTRIWLEMDGTMALVANPGKAFFNRFQTNIFKVASSAVAPFVHNSMTFSLSTSKFSTPKLLLPAGATYPLELHEGLQLDFTASFNPKCSNILLAFLGSTMESFKFSLVPTKMLLLSDTPLPSRVVSEQLSFVDPRIQLKSNLDLSGMFAIFKSLIKIKSNADTQIQFTTSANIIPSIKDVELPLFLVESWNGAFGFKNLIITALSGALLIDSLSSLLSVVSLRGMASIGGLSASVAVYLSLKNFIYNYFLIDLKALRLSSMLTQFFDSTNWKLPFAAQFALFDRARISYALTAIPEKNIPAGLSAKGRGNILGFPCTLDVGVTPVSFSFSARMDPVQKGSFLLSEDVDASNMGVLIKYESNHDTPINLQVRARVSSFLFANAVTLEFNDKGIAFNVATALFSTKAMLYASLTAATYKFTAVFTHVKPFLKQVIDILKSWIIENQITDQTTEFVKDFADKFALGVSGDLSASDAKQLTFFATLNGKEYRFNPVESLVKLADIIGSILNNARDSLVAELRLFFNKWIKPKNRS